MLLAIKKHIISWNNSLGWLLIIFIKYIPSRRLRILLLRSNDAQISKDVAMFASIEIRCPQGLRIGGECSIGHGVLLDARRGITIGNRETIAYNALILSLHHEINAPNFHAKGSPVFIDDYACICSRIIILPGVHFGKGVVVTKDVEPYSTWCTHKK